MLKKNRAILLAACAQAVSLSASEEAWMSGVETWGGRKAVPAVVNPVLRSPLQEVLSLRGEWDFVAMPPDRPRRHPGWDRFFSKPWGNTRTIQVLGCWEAQGVGEPGMSTTWDCLWDCGPKPLRNIFMGEGWYRKTVDIPTAWRGKRVWIKIGGVRAQGWFWVNNTPVAWVDSYCGTYKYDITDLVSAGTQAVVVAAVNNIVPSRKGGHASTHKFGGIYRDIELEATPDTRIDDAWVRGDFDGQAAEIHATVAYAVGAARLKNPVLRVKATPADGAVSRGAKTQGAGESHHAPVIFPESRCEAEVTVRVPLSPFRPWSPEQPDLYVAELTLCDGDTPVHGWTERFGVRKIEVRGKRFFLNNRPFFVRGFGDPCRYPLTHVSPPDRETHLRHLKLAKACGFNYIRTHTKCELPEYFEAADEAGLMVQPELPYYGDYPTEAFTFDPLRDLRELYRHYRRHVSFTTYSTGNEGLLGKPLDRAIYELAKRLDPDRLMLHQDGAFNTAENSDFRNGPITVWAPGSFACDAPFVAHEYLNQCVKYDPRIEPKFTGAWMPMTTVAAWETSLAAAGLDRRWGDAIQDAQPSLQRHYQKQGLEAARLDPACGGYSFWHIVDAASKQGASYGANGVFDLFWDVKPNGFTPEAFRLFNGPTALLLKTDPAARIAVSGDAVKTAFWISHYGERRLAQARLRWTLHADSAVLAQGECAIEDVEPGSTRLLKEEELIVPPVVKPVHAVLEVSALTADQRPPDIRNAWDFWLFPARPRQKVTGVCVSPALSAPLEKLYAGLVAAGSPEAERATLLIARGGEPEIAQALEAGKRVLVVSTTDGAPNVELGWWTMGSQVGTALARHPALGDLPHEGSLSPLLFRIMKQGRKLPFEGVKADSMFIVGEGREHYYLYLGEGLCGKGRVLLSYGLDVVSGTPEGTSLLDGMIRYAQSDAFTPSSAVQLDLQVWNGWSKTIKAGDVGKLAVARAMKGKNELIWETLPMPKDVRGKPEHVLLWRGGMGYFSEPPGRFALFVNEEKLIEIPELSQQDAAWFSADKTARLTYERDTATQDQGIFKLTLPSARLTPGKSARLKVVGSDSGSRRWFGICQSW